MIDAARRNTGASDQLAIAANSQNRRGETHYKDTKKIKGRIYYQLSTIKSLTFNERIFVDGLGPSQNTQPRPDLVQKVLPDLKYENM